MTSQPRRPRQSSPGRPRSAEAGDRIVEAAAALLRKGGPGAVNIATVAERSGAARTTIYRRYRDRGELLQAALRPVVDAGQPAEDLPVRDKIAWFLATTEQVLTGSIGLGGVGAVVGDSDPEFSTALRTTLATALAPLRRQVADDIRAGRLVPGVDEDVVVDLMLGAYLAEIVRHGRSRRQWRRRTADVLATMLEARPA